MTNEKLKEIKERLLAENDKRRRLEQEQANACANYYERGVNDALAAVSFVRPEQQSQPASEARTNLDRIRAMSAEEIAEWVDLNLECCSCPISSQVYSCETTNCVATFIKWLNSPVKEDTE
ncbi:MAG: hypothetical protein KH345_08420 [Eubacterium sp.]|jgi:hypothetical protein|nr:hypothetical protein [Eubacterium sp.]